MYNLKTTEMVFRRPWSMLDLWSWSGSHHDDHLIAQFSRGNLIMALEL